MGYRVPVEPGISLYVEDLDPGNGKPVLFIHGWPSNHRMFEYQLDVLPHWGYRCIAPDLRGFGQSDHPWSGYSYDRLSSDIRMLIDHLGLKGLTLVGYSVGGAIAIRYMAENQGHRVAKLVLVSAAAPSFVERPGFPHGLPVDQVHNLIDGTYQDRPTMLTKFGANFFSHPTSPGIYSWMHDLGMAASGHATVAVLRSLLKEDLRGDLASIHVPTLICHGVKDQVCPFELAEVMHAGIKGSKLVPFTESGHGLYYTEGEKLNRELAAFIG